MKKIDTAMVLAAGLGTRMRAAENDPPKPLTMLGDTTLLDRMLDKLAQAGIVKAVINVHHKADWIEAHLAARQEKYPHPRIIISDERDGALETGGGVKKALPLLDPLLNNAPFIVCNSDVFWRDDVDNLAQMITAFDANHMQALLLLAAMETASGYEGRGDFVRGFDGRLKRCGANADEGTPYIYAGAQIVTPEFVRAGGAGREDAFSFNVLWDKALSVGGVFGHILQGQWMHIGTPEGLTSAQKEVQNWVQREIQKN